MEDLVSVIVPVYKVEIYLDRCIKSIVEQTYKNLEIILVDDGSPDGCSKICDEWAKKDRRIKVIHKKNGGVSSARNVGLKEAQGQWICFVDSDDMIHCKMIQLLTDNIVNEDLICTGYSNDINILTKDTGSYNILTPTKDEAITICLINRNNYCSSFKVIMSLVSPWSKLYKKDIIDKISLNFPLELKIGEDRIFNILYIEQCEKIKLIDFAGYFYYDNENSVMKTINKAYLENHMKYYNYLHKICIENNLNLDKMCKEHKIIEIYDVIKRIQSGHCDNIKEVTGQGINILYDFIAEYGSYRDLYLGDNETKLFRVIMFFIKHKCFSIARVIIKLMYKKR